MNVAFDFWSNDTIVITLDSKWSIDSDTVGCASRDLGDDVPNYFQW